MRLAGQIKGGFYPTPPRVVGMIAAYVAAEMPQNSGRGRRNRRWESQGRTLRLLDPCCGTGEALQLLAQDLGQRFPMVETETCGVELHRERSEEAAGRLDHTLGGDLFGSTIANRAFGLLFLNPPYDHDQKDLRVEHSFLLHCTRYLVERGVLVYIVPRRSLAVSLRFLAANYSQLRAYSFPEPECERFDQVVVFGHRKAESHVDRDSLESARNELLGPDMRHLAPGFVPAYDAPLSKSGEFMFSLRIVNPEAAAAQARRAGLWADPEVTEALFPVNGITTRPLMPLRRGHMALLVAAGFMDNMCLETEDRRVLVKGRAVKEKVLVEEDDEIEVYREQLKTTVTVLDLESGEVIDVAA